MVFLFNLKYTRHLQAGKGSLATLANATTVTQNLLKIPFTANSVSNA